MHLKDKNKILDLCGRCQTWQYMKKDWKKETKTCPKCGKVRRDVTKDCDSNEKLTFGENEGIL